MLLSFKGDNRIRLVILTVCLLFSVPFVSEAQHIATQQGKLLKKLQQNFVNLRFGMFIHFNIPTYINQDWVDPNAPVSLFDPKKLDASQWAKAAKSANMKFGVLTTKHHSGFAIWDTKTTDYSVMNSPYKKDVVKQYTDAFRKQGLKVMLYYSILDTHHDIRPGKIDKKDVDFIKTQLTELLTNYGKVSALIIDGWDAPWSRISYDDIPFEEIYSLVKSLQPNCLVMDLNSAKYPSQALFYSDIKSYEQNAGQMISRDTNKLPALSCLPINRSWFWKKSFPEDPVKDPSVLVNKNLIPQNRAYCTFILNVAPNRDGLIDDNALAALKKIGDQWDDDDPPEKLPPEKSPIISHNLAKNKPSNASWSHDMWIMDFGNDDDFDTAWISNKKIENPWYEVDFDRDQSFNMIVITEGSDSPHINNYQLQYYINDSWKPILTVKNNKEKVKIHRFKSVWGGKVRILIDTFDGQPSIAEFGVYKERRK